MANKGRRLSEDETRKIVGLLEATEMTIPEIATRMNRSRGAVIGVNRRYRVRDYGGRRTQWAAQSKKMG